MKDLSLKKTIILALVILIGFGTTKGNIIYEKITFPIYAEYVLWRSECQQRKIEKKKAEEKANERKSTVNFDYGLDKEYNTPKNTLAMMQPADTPEPEDDEEQ